MSLQGTNSSFATKKSKKLVHSLAEFHQPLLFQDSIRPKAPPPRDLLVVVKLSNSAVEPVRFVPFLAVVLPIYRRPSPSGARIVLAEVECYCICE